MNELLKSLSFSLFFGADMFIISSTKWTGPCNRNAQLLTKCTWLFNTHSIEEAFSHYSHILQSAARVITREFWSSSFCFHTLENNGKNINVSSALQECLEYNTKTRHNQWNIYVLQISYSLCIFDLRLQNHIISLSSNTWILEWKVVLSFIVISPNLS